MASSNSSAARKKPGAKKKTAETVAANGAPQSEGKKDANVTSAKVVSISEISSKAAEPGKLKLWFEAIKRFLKSVRSEMDRVSWPSWRELRLSTVVVVVTLMLVSMYMGVVDWILSLVFGTPSTGF